LATNLGIVQNIMAYNYSDIYLIPRCNTLESRSLADTSVTFLGRKFDIPVVPANMSSVIDENIAFWLSENDLPYIYHRFGDNREFIKKAQDWKLVSISVGVKSVDKELINWAIDNNLRIDWITIDIAHGYSNLMKDMIEFINNKSFSIIKDGKIINYKPYIIAGNVASHDAVKFLINCGADACKIGIAGGGACSTKTQTSFHVPMFTCVEDCAVRDLFTKRGERACYIYDGGIRENGDIFKALYAGTIEGHNSTSNLVMCGSLFAACSDSPAEQFENGTKHYYGSASATQKGNNVHVEGFDVNLRCNNLTVAEKYAEIKGSLQSSISYAGCSSLDGIGKCRYVSVYR
jgi:GMP reductase